MYQPGLLFVPFGLAHAEEIVRSRRRQLRAGIDFHESEIEQVVLEDDRVRLSNGTELAYDALVVASGAVLQPEETEGLTGPAGTSGCSRSTTCPGPSSSHVRSTGSAEDASS